MRRRPPRSLTGQAIVRAPPGGQAARGHTLTDSGAAVSLHCSAARDPVAPAPRQAGRGLRRAAKLRRNFSTFGATTTMQ